MANDLDLLPDAADDPEDDAPVRPGWFNSPVDTAPAPAAAAEPEEPDDDPAATAAGEPDSLAKIAEELKKRDDAIAQLNQTIEVQRRLNEKKVEELTRGVAQAQRPAAPAPQQPWTQEQLRELFQTEPERATALMVEYALQRQNENHQSRMTGFVQSAAQLAMEAAQTKHAEDFAEFKDQILEAANNLSPEQLANPSMWDQIVTYVKGQNVDKVVEREIKKREQKKQAEARAAQQQRTGFTGVGRTAPAGTPAPTGPGGKATYGLSPLQMKHAEAFGVSFKDFADELKKMQRGE